MCRAQALITFIVLFIEHSNLISTRVNPAFTQANVLVSVSLKTIGLTMERRIWLSMSDDKIIQP